MAITQAEGHAPVQLRFEHASVGLALADSEGRYTEVNPALCAILGRPKEELLGHTLAQFADGDATSEGFAPERSSLPHDRRRAELRVVRPDGCESWVEVTATLVSGAAGEKVWIEQVHDVTDRKRAEAALEKLSTHDPLTGLPNRDLLKERIERALDRAHQDGSMVAVALVGIDRFRVVNDSLGHSAGDELLVQFADILQACAPGQTVARVGADVFAIVVATAATVSETVEWVQYRLGSVSERLFDIKGSELYVAFSTGIAFSGPDVDAEELICNADLAMDRAKEVGGGHVVTFEERHLTAARERLALETDLRRAMAENQITVAYQPVVRTDDHRVVGAEALARWRHPHRGDVPPDVFMPVLARLGLTRDVTYRVLRAACAQLSRWRGEGKVADDFRVSVNLSSDDLANPSLVDELRQVLETFGLSPGSLTLEVTETGLVRDTQAALERLRAVRRLGVHLAVDDFGTGYSSLSYLNMFPVDVVKIDKSFVLGLGRDANATALVRGTLSLTRALGLTAVAEGIENDIQLEALRQLGCELAQGFLWSPAVPAEEFPLAFSMPPAPDKDALLALARPGPQVTDHDQHLGWAVLDALPTAVAVISPQGTVLATNLSWKSIALECVAGTFNCGVGANYLAACEAAQGPGAEDAALAARGLRAVLAGERDAFSLEYDVPGSSGVRRYLMLVSPVASRRGGAVVAHLDISDRHLAETALAESEERFHGIFDQAPIGILRLDAGGFIIDVNPALCQLAGRPSADLLGKRREELFEDEPPTVPERSRVALGGQPRTPQSSQRKVRRPDGSVRVVRVNDVQVNGPEGGPHTLVATVEDVTEGMRLAEDLHKAQEMEALGRLAAGIAHEINTPTQFISDNLTFLSTAWEPVARLLDACRDAIESSKAGGPAGEVIASLGRFYRGTDLDFIMGEVPQALAQSHEGVERVASIVRAMKAFGHPDGDDPEPTDLNRLVTDTLVVARNELKYVADVAINLGPLPTVECYPGAVGQVLLNLLVNAAYALRKSFEVTGLRGQVSVKTWEEGQEAHIEISDTGPGIPPEALPHIFEPFFTTKPVGQGTGQGLAMAWATIVERHHGHIDVRTSASGTTFVVRLPCRQAQSAPMALAGRGPGLAENA